MVSDRSRASDVRRPRGRLGGVKHLCTIGYERASLNEVIAALRDAGVEVVLDVRELPNSRRAGFSRRLLESGLAEAGIGYRHFKALGTPKAGRDASKRGDKETMRAIFGEKLAQPESQLALQEAGEIASEKRACLLCLEHDWRGCHRAMVADALEAQGFKAEHLEPEASR